MSRPEQLALPGAEPRPGKPPLVISASRRTDLPGFYPDRLVDRVKADLDRGGAPLYGLVLWTRFPAALLGDPLRSLLEREVRNVVVNLTVTGLGGSRLEPRAPRTDEAVRAGIEAIDLLGGEPARLRWRFDPLLYGRNGLDVFDRIAGPFAAASVPTVTVSFPSAMSLAGPLGPRYAAAGIEPWPGIAAKAAFAAGLAERARDHGLRVLACCQPKVLARVPAIEGAQCIPREVLEAFHPEAAPFPEARDRTQRRHCACLPSLDIGRYDEDLCGSGCAYCYSRAGGPAALERRDEPLAAGVDRRPREPTRIGGAGARPPARRLKEEGPDGGNSRL